MKKPLSKKVKSWILVSIVWLILTYLAATDSYWGFNLGFFIIVAILPLVIGWGIYWIRKE